MALNAVTVAKRLRRWQPLNVAVRVALRRLLRLAGRLEALSVDWRIAGTPELEFHGARFRMLGRSDDPFLDHLFYERTWEPGETQLFALLAPGAGVILDLGANTGTYSLMSTRLAPDATVVAVEPAPANAERLRANVELNRADRITVIEAAVGAANGEIRLTVPSSGTLSDVASVVDDFSRAHHGIAYSQVTVELITIDELVRRQGLTRVDVIKLDVEYGELAALQGARETLARFAPVVLAEVFDYDVFTGDKPQLRDHLAPDNADRVQRLVADAGYVIFAIGRRGLLRVSALGGIPDGGSNYLFVKGAPDVRYVPYSDERAIRDLIGPASIGG